MASFSSLSFIGIEIFYQKMRAFAREGESIFPGIDPFGDWVWSMIG
jgi:hypothetical protein